jgi:sulfite reductase (NADPH) flavoprotein alpha-component
MPPHERNCAPENAQDAMSHIAPIVPDNSPFSPAQRAWLNGLLAGLIGADQSLLADAGTQTVGTPTLSVPQAAPAQPEEFPWHDPALPIDERMKLADDRPLERRMMAAMGQLDCGQCGYLCQTYAEAIACGEEKSLTRCVPGGKETARVLKELVASPPAAAAGATSPPTIQAASASPAPGPPLLARFEGALRLNREGSEKDTRHVVFRHEDLSLGYKVGDALGVHVANEPEIVAAIIERLAVPAACEVDCPDGIRRALREALVEACDIGRPSDQAIEVLASRARDPGEADRLQALAEGYPGAEPANADLLDLLLAFPSAQPPIEELILALGRLEPRLYSIASSPKLHPGEVHLTVAAVRYAMRGRLRKGVASSFLAERAQQGGAVSVFVKPAHGFDLPADPSVPIVMIGPGTGIAPFRAFLEDRRVTGANGKNWLFFGDQRRELDFLYGEELEAFRTDGLLTRLDLAFSRDQAEKIYVQHRMREQAAELYAWIQDGAHLYVCGDATRMARDVDVALAHIIAKQGGMGLSAARSHLAELARAGRYQRDVY